MNFKKKSKDISLKIFETIHISKNIIWFVSIGVTSKVVTINLDAIGAQRGATLICLKSTQSNNEKKMQIK